MLGALLLLAAVSLILYAFYKWATLNNDYFERRNIKYIKPTFLFGINAGIFLNKYTAAEFSDFFYQAFPKDIIFGFFDFRKPNYVIRDPEIIKRIGIKDFDHFEDHPEFADENTEVLFSNSLIFIKGEKWRQMRSTLSPAFTGSKMRQMFELVTECTDDVVNHFLKRAKNGEKINVEMKDFFSRYANDVIATCAFGLKVNSFDEPENEFYLNGKVLTNLDGFKQILKIVLVTQLPALARALGISLTGGEIGNKFRATILDTMKIRKEKNIFRPDMINIMMQIREGTLQYQSNEKEEGQDGFAAVEESDVGKVSVNRKWSDDEILAQCFLFFFAGFDTTSTMLTFAAYELAINPDIQQKLHDEITEMDKQLGGKRITYDELQKMKYLDQVVSEVLRKWPPNTILDRVCVKDYTLNVGDQKTVHIEKDMDILTPIFSIHRDSNYYPSPEKFDPDRFSDENKGNIVPGTYLPFGLGPRNCIGSRFALMEIKAILYYLLLIFTFEPNEKTPIPMKLKKSALNLLPADGMHLELVPRFEK